MGNDRETLERMKFMVLTHASCDEQLADVMAYLDAKEMEHGYVSVGESDCACSGNATVNERGERGSRRRVVADTIVAGSVVSRKVICIG